MPSMLQLLLGGSQPPVVDPYFYSVTSLLHGDGTNGAQNNTFLDSSTNNFTITRNGNTTQGSFSPFSQTGWGGYFDGSGDYCTLSSNASMDFGTGNFTIECWVFTGVFSVSAGASRTIIGNSGNSYTMQLYIDTTSGRVVFGNTGSTFLQGTSTVADNQWHHIAVSRSGTGSNQIALFVDGQRQAVGTNSQNYSSGTIYLGAFDTGNGFWNGYISNLRIVKGTAVYDPTATSITVPTTPLTAISNTALLTFQSNRFLDNSTNAYTVTKVGDTSIQPFSPFNPTTAYSTSAVGGSGYFDGSGDYLETTSSQIIPSGNFTIEAWAYITSSSSTQTIVAQGTGVGDGARTWMGIENSSGARWAVQVGGTQAISSVAPVLNAWHYLAMVYNGSTIKMYLNGTEIASASSTTNASNTTLKIGTNWGGYITTGFLSNIRISNTARTISAVPSSLLAADANTVFLANFTNAGIFDNAADADYETVGNAQISTSVKKYGTGSMAFDGTGDYLVTYPPSVQQFAFGTGDFTIECWAYFNSTSGDGFIYDSRGPEGLYPSIYRSTTSIIFYTNSAARITASSAVTTNTWYHIALCRVAGQTKLFINGTQVGSTYADTNSYLNAANRPMIGAAGVDGYVGTVGLNGYIDDVRVSKGVGRYPYNFTPPTAEFPNIGGTVTLTADPYFYYTTLLLPGNGTNGAQNNTFLDSSTNAFSITRNGNTTQGTFSPFSQTGWGNYFSGSSTFVSAPANAAFSYGTGDYTYEAWIYPTADGTATTYRFIMGAGVSGQGDQWNINNAGNRTLVYGDGANVFTTTNQFVLNAWNHIALSRNSGTLRIFINGLLGASGASTTNITLGGSQTFYVGNRSGGADSPQQAFVGYMSNVRVLKGVGLYTANFTPPTTPLTAISGTSLLTCQSNRFVDNSSNNFTISKGGDTSIQAFSPFNPTAAWSAATYGGSGYFDGSGDYLQAGTNANLALGSGDFTIDGWHYCTGYNGGAALYSTINTYPSSTGLLFYIETAGKYTIDVNGTILQPAGAATLNAWVHWAVVRNGSTLSIYINGTSIGSVSSSTNFTDQYAVVGRTGAGANSNLWLGYLSGVRMVKGTAVYTGSFTPPTAPPTAISNTQFLLNYTNAGIYDATSKNDLETVGNAQISTTQSKFGGSSIYLDGTDDRLPAAANNDLVFGTGDFTVEGWFYTGVPANNRGLFQISSTAGGLEGGNTNNVAVYCSSSVLGAYYNDTFKAGTTAISSNTWTHFALVKYSGNIKLYVNGTADSGFGTNSDTRNYTGKNICVGGYFSTSYLWSGYIQDFRVTKGIARYTSNFTPPTTAFLTL